MVASVVITVERGENAPSALSLRAIAAARGFADEHGATIYASCSLTAEDDLDDWVTALATAGCDRVAIARNPGAPSDNDPIHAEIIKRLLPVLVLVPAEEHASDRAEALCALLGATVADNLALDDAAGLSGSDLTIAAISEGDSLPEADVVARGSDDIDVLFYDVDPDSESTPHAESTPS